MASDKNVTDKGMDSDRGKDGAAAPDWANGLRQFYDSVVDEPIPDSFKDLLDKLDDHENASGKGSGR
ncbi:NepR family anti-sigma factor [Erythrobacter crassostreae]|uniref:Anti-sigma factor NepR domain-containing protein n=1 Tax=Erythrobacter crassostreae TaxID=2828328 RepID=A0A9X1F0L0_9SPHN|nr:NepR family anti-sigma factor [Erythrobacter crassostrea]MBV7258136.1 hypothetical protein [Erythrobacter crassostrea]